MTANSLGERGWRHALARTAHWVLARVEPVPATSRSDATSASVLVPPPVPALDSTPDLESRPRWADETIDLTCLDERFAEFMQVDFEPSIEERWLLGL